MMGTRQKIKSGLEYDVLYDRRTFCYLVNHSSLKKFAKKCMARRRRRDDKKIITREYNGML